VEEAATSLGVTKLTTVTWLKKLGLVAYRFPGTNRKTYIKTEDQGFSQMLRRTYLDCKSQL